MTDEMRAILPKTDTRLRKDRLALEQVTMFAVISDCNYFPKQNLKLAGIEKRKLEERERAKRRLREAKNAIWRPKYFVSIVF